MQQGDTSNSYYQFYQSHFHNPNPNPTPNPIDPQFTPYSAADQLNYSSGYPPYAQNPDQIVSSVPTAPAYPTNPNPQFSSPSLYPYDQNYPPLNYPPPVSNPNPSYSGPPYPPSYGGASGVPSYDLSLDNSKKFDSWGGYVEENLGAVYGPGFDQERFRGDGVYRYEGGKVEPYGARGAAGGGGGSSSSFSSNVMFDDYGLPINVSSGAAGGGSKPPSKVVRAVPKVEMEEDVKGGVQKFRVKLLSEGYGQSDTDVLCQIGLDGIRMLDPATSRTLRIYSLDTVTRSEVLDSHIFAFWAKTSVDIEPKRIRLKSNSYTTNTILDAVTAASVQLKEIGESRDSNSFNASDLQFERKKGFGDWMNLIKPPNEEKDHWVPDEAVTKCTSCSTNFNAFVRKHHCRNCGEIFCDKCTQGRTPLTSDEQAQPVRVCDRCMGEVTERLANAGEAATRTGATHSHEDLARKLKEQMDRNLKASSGSKSEGSQTQMREVACPTCTVHLQVEVPSTGSETIECSVCQHPFLVNAN